MRFSISSLSTLSLLSQCLAAAPTWPASTDEIEDIMFLTAGYRSRAFADLVTPCSKSPNMPGRINAAEWIRSGFHDMATADVTSGVVVGGLDASLMFETGRSENSGPAFTTTFIFLQQYFSVRASIADLLALSMYTAVRACGGPVVPVRGGRIDATAAGALGVPMPENPTLTFVAQFARMGFNRSEMIDATACGHTIGGVHSAQNPLIVPVGTATNEYALFDDPTQAQSTFNNKVATEFILGNTTNPLVVGISKTNGRNSDFRVFAVDGNATINSLTDPAVFARRCAIILQKIIDTVPAGVSLSAAIEPYEVKPVNPQLTLLAGGASLKFSGEIRVRTTVRAASQIASVQLVYKNRSGGAGGTIATAVVGTGTGFDDSFTVRIRLYRPFIGAKDTNTSILSSTASRKPSIPPRASLLSPWSSTSSAAAPKPTITTAPATPSKTPSSSNPRNRVSTSSQTPRTSANSPSSPPSAATPPAPLSWTSPSRPPAPTASSCPSWCRRLSQ
jgi:hypothetical protein